uniref:MSP domain-containing protein n=1 Tax=Eucampia antarctica TaxID=49252 RepID=A0A7S2RAX6_9STRA
MADTPYALEISPDSTLQFTLTRGTANDGRSTVGESTPRCTMSLRHPGKTKEHLAFKVKTTQPRRYLVRPNQGVVAPGTTEKVTILLVEKDKQILLQSYDRLGQTALDHSKDKFLVQSCTTPDDFASRYMSAKADSTDDSEGNRATKELAESLTTMWNSAAGGDLPIYNKKLHVHHVVSPSDSASAKGGNAPQPLEEKPSMENMSPDQIYAEVSSLRRKYDELVSFSVNLTAERDILNNTLEQTKRDLNRETMAKAALENKGLIGARSKGVPKQSSRGFSLFSVIFVALTFTLLGIKGATSGVADILIEIPVIGPFLDLGPNEVAVEVADEVSSVNIAPVEPEL